MRKSIIGKALALTTFLLMIIWGLGFARAGEVTKIQGLIMSVDLQKNMMIVNERTFTWDQNTKFYNEKGSPVTVDRLRAKMWVYIEGFKDSTKKGVMAEKVYTLPKYIDKKEKHLYPFLNEAKPTND